MLGLGKIRVEVGENWGRKKLGLGVSVGLSIKVRENYSWVLGLRKIRVGVGF